MCAGFSFLRSSFELLDSPEATLSLVVMIKDMRIKGQVLVAGGEAWHPPASQLLDGEVHAEEERWSPWAIGHAESEDGSGHLAPHAAWLLFSTW